MSMKLSKNHSGTTVKTYHYKKDRQDELNQQATNGLMENGSDVIVQNIATVTTTTTTTTTQEVRQDKDGNVSPRSKLQTVRKSYKQGEGGRSTLRRIEKELKEQEGNDAQGVQHVSETYTQAKDETEILYRVEKKLSTLIGNDIQGVTKIYEDVDGGRDTLRRIEKELTEEGRNDVQRHTSSSMSPNENSLQETSPRRSSISPQDRKKLVIEALAIKTAAKIPSAGPKQHIGSVKKSNNDDDLGSETIDDIETNSNDRDDLQQLMKKITPKTKTFLGLDKQIDKVRTTMLRGGKYGYGIKLGEDDGFTYISEIVIGSVAARSPLQIGDIIYSINGNVIGNKEEAEDVMDYMKNVLICIAIRTDRRMKMDEIYHKHKIRSRRPVAERILTKKKAVNHYYNPIFRNNKLVEPLVHSATGGIANRAILEGWNEFVQRSRTARLNRCKEQGWKLDSDEVRLLHETDESINLMKSRSEDSLSKVKVSDSVRSLLTSESWHENMKNKLKGRQPLVKERIDAVDSGVVEDEVDAISQDLLNQRMVKEDIVDTVETSVEVNVTMLPSTKVYKIVLVGDSGVGKSSFINRFCHHSFDLHQAVTIDIGLHNKPVLVDDTVVMLEIWDTVGQERFHSLPPSYFRQAHALLVLFDITKKASFDNINMWLSNAKTWVQDSALLIIIGNKLDMTADRKVSKEEGCLLAMNENAMYAETSAKTGENIFETCHQLARHLHETYHREDEITSYNNNNVIKIANDNKTIALASEKSTTSRCC